MRDPDNRASIREDVQRYRNFLKSDTLEEDARRVLHMLLKEAERQLAKLERRAKRTKREV